MDPVTRAPGSRRGLTFGLMLMLLGIALVLDNTGLVHLPPGGRWLSWWSLLFISLGVAKLITPRWNGRREGVGLLFFGSWLLLNQLHVLGRDSWPILRVGIGTSIVWNALVGPPAARE